MATIKDVAEEAGLAVSTVSRVLNNRGYISESARKKVNDAMVKLNYQPNELARSLHRKNTNTIGLIVPHIRHSYFAEVISRLEYYAYKKGYKVLIYNTKGNAERERECFELCRSNRVDGIIMCTGGISLEGFHHLGLPVVAFERDNDVSDSTIMCDNELGGKLAAEHLIGKGCHHIIHIGDLPLGHSMPADTRGIGFRKVLEKHDVPYVCVTTDSEEYVNMEYHVSIDQLFETYPNVDGIFANSDIIAAQVLQVCRRRGIRVPDDVKVVGFDDTSLAKLTAPTLTTIHQPIDEMAEICIQTFDQLVNEKMVPASTVLPVKLVERESTAN